MSAKWTVRKRDGAWQCFDSDGRARYASESWSSVLTFALMGFYEMTQRQQIEEVVRRISRNMRWEWGGE